MPGKWFDIYSDGTTSNSWTSNLIVSNASKVIASAISNLPNSETINISGCDWDQSTKRITKPAVTDFFTNYVPLFTDSDYFLIRAGTGISTVGNMIKITNVDTSSYDYITLETDLHGSSISDDSIAGTIFRSQPRMHNLYLAIGTGSSSWDSETPYPIKTATQLTNEYFRKPISRIVNIKEYNGSISSATSTTLVSSEFNQFSSDCIGQLVEIIDGPGTGQVRQVLSFTSPDTMTISTGSTDWSVTPTSASKYRVGIPQHTSTGIIDIITIIEQNEGNANGTIREMGLFGADATSVIGTGQLINLIHHTSITKNSSNSLTRVMRLRFEVV